MKKTMTFGIAALLLGSLVSSSAHAQTAAEVLEKMIEANGGRKALEAIKDTTISGNAEMPSMGVSGSVTTYHKEPGMTRQDMNIGWATKPQQAKWTGNLIF